MGETKTGVLLVQLGTPDAPEEAALRRYLKQFLADPRVVDLPRWKWLPILHGIILNTRPQRSARLYKRIWQEGGSPLRLYSQAQTQAVAQNLAGHAVVRLAMRYGSPGVEQVLTEMMDSGITQLLIFPLFPQYASSTTASIADAGQAFFKKRRFVPALRLAAPFPADPGYIAALAGQVGHMDDEVLIVSFHGQPVRYIEDGDPYLDHCQETARLLAQHLGLAESQWRLAFQSRFGKEPWIGPATDDVLASLPGEGVKRIAICCPGFVSDCLETLDEIGHEARMTFMQAGGEHFRFIPCLNDHPAWTAALTRLVRQELAGWLPPDHRAT